MTSTMSEQQTFTDDHYLFSSFLNITSLLRIAVTAAASAATASVASG